MLTPEQRAVVVAAIQETSAVRGWQLFSLNVRTNHVHLVVRADNEPPEKVMNSLKSYGTRYLRAAGLAPAGAVWSRHGSTDYLWKEKDVEATMWYVVHGQDKAVGDEQQR